MSAHFLSRPIGILCFLAFTFGTVTAQKTTVNINAYSGLFSFRGDAAVSTSRFIAGLDISTGISSPYRSYNIHGSLPAFSYSLEGQLVRNTKHGFLYGIGIAYEMLTSKVNIDSTVYYGEPATIHYDAKGSSKLKNTFITLNPFAGKRIFNKKISVDVLAGMDIAFCIRSHENGQANTITSTSYSEYITTNIDEPRPEVDVRPRLQLNMHYKKAGFLFGYSLGLTDYHIRKDYSNDYSKSFSSFLRFGLSYQIR
jgi:hypothetical protein